MTVSFLSGNPDDKLQCTIRELNSLLHTHFLHGLLVASLICELRAGSRASENAMAIMKYRTTAELALSQGKTIPEWSL